MFFSDPCFDSQVERKTLTAVLMQRCDEDEADGGWRVAGFGDTAEEDYLTHKADEDDEDRGNLVLFKFFKMELYQGGRCVTPCVDPHELIVIPTRKPYVVEQS